MSNVGGETVCKTVRNVMTQTIRDELAQIYTWTGQKKKLALKQTNSRLNYRYTFMFLSYNFLNMSFNIINWVMK